MSFNSQQPIGMLDSGLGGLTVLATVKQMLPSENYLYYADFSHSPYGGRGKAELLSIIDGAVKILLAKGIKALVFACNTATSVAVEHCRAKLSIPVIGLEPALKPAVEITPNGKILVLATELTLKEEKFNKLYQQYRNQAEIILKSCPGLVELIDEGETSGPSLHAFLEELFQPLERETIRTIVLGCTHYVIIKDAIRKHFPEAGACVDGNEGAARHLLQILEQSHLLNSTRGLGSIGFLSSAPQKISFLEDKYPAIQKILSGK